jgi:hypothetical protein
MARPDAYREANPGRYALMHFSAHAVANKESPLDSAIILSGPVTISSFTPGTSSIRH